MCYDRHMVHILLAGVTAGQEEPAWRYSLHRPPLVVPPHRNILACIRYSWATVAILTTVFRSPSGLPDARCSTGHLVFFLAVPFHLKSEGLLARQQRARQSNALAVLRSPNPGRLLGLHSIQGTTLTAQGYWYVGVLQ